MYDCRQFFINGEWITPAGRKESLVINPATEEPVGRILLGTAEDVDAATRAAKFAFERYSQTSREERIALFERIVKIYEANIDRLAWAVSDEMGAPMQAIRIANDSVYGLSVTFIRAASTTHGVLLLAFAPA